VIAATPNITQNLMSEVLEQQWLLQHLT